MNKAVDERLAKALANADADDIAAFFGLADSICGETIRNVVRSSEATVVRAGLLASAGLTALIAASEFADDDELWLSKNMTAPERVIFDAVALNARDLGRKGRKGVVRLQQRVGTAMMSVLDGGVVDPGELLDRIMFWTIVSVARGLADGPNGAEIGVGTYMMDRFKIDDPAGPRRSPPEESASAPEEAPRLGPEPFVPTPMDDPSMLVLRYKLALVSREWGRTDEAVAQLETLLPDEVRVLGPDHENTLTTRGNLALLLAEAGRVDEAIAQFETLLPDLVRVLGTDHHDTLTTRNNLEALLLDRNG